MIYFICFLIAIAGLELIDKGQYAWAALFLAGAVAAALIAKWIDRKYSD